MERKIIELIKTNEDYKCIICCKNDSIMKMRINRLVLNDNITSFSVCNECLAKMQKEIEICE